MSLIKPRTAASDAIMLAVSEQAERQACSSSASSMAAGAACADSDLSDRQQHQQFEKDSRSNGRFLRVLPCCSILMSDVCIDTMFKDVRIQQQASTSFQDMRLKHRTRAAGQHWQ
eukprot:GHUV01031462.1.p2 GENE.GHUV01031462.1~~GHUV01031462.1.p2  ORF type:complete len:115 (-),score=44.43 GHUV01031462.1:130-474(-)